MSQFSAGSKAPTPSSSPPNDSPISNASNPKDAFANFHNHQRVPSRPLTPPSNGDYGSPLNGSPSNSPHRHKRSNSRPLSMVQTYQPRIMDVNEDTVPELQPVFSFLNNHANKLYHEGYFLKLDDQNSRMSLLPHFLLLLATPVQRLGITLLSPQRSRNRRILLTWYFYNRGQAQCGPHMDRMLCPARRHCPVPLGRRRARFCWRGWRGPAQVPQLDRCLN